MKLNIELVRGARHSYEDGGHFDWNFGPDGLVVTMTFKNTTNIRLYPYTSIEYVEVENDTS